MAKSKIIQSDKRQLLKIFKAERKEKWCALAKKIHDEGAVLTVDIDADLEKLRSELNSLQDQIWVLEDRKNNILQTNKLKLGFGIDHYFYGSNFSCTIEDLHPEVIQFINEYREKEKKLLLLGNEGDGNVQ